MLNPYEITVVESGYEFSTDNQIIYYVYFTDVSETFNERDGVYSFGFEPRNVTDQVLMPKDQRVGDTIAKIIESFFIKNKNVIVYVPYDKDKKDKLRMRLFDIWFNKYQDKVACPKLNKDRISLILSDEIYLDVTAIFGIEQTELAQKILFGDVPEIWDASKN